MKKLVMEQIRFVCKSCEIEYNEDFIQFVYNKHLEYFSGEIIKELKKEYDIKHSMNKEG